VIVAPGGGFHFLADEHEGTDVATWLAERGIAALVLRYRVLPTADDDETFESEFDQRMANVETFWSLTNEARAMAVADGHQAMRLARRRAGEWGLDPERIGIMGFSAGGYVASWVALQTDAETRPAFVAPIYGAPFGEFSVPGGAPPMFLTIATDDDLIVPNSLTLYSAWREAGGRVEMHVFSRGGHGFGMHKNGLPSDHWIDRFLDWLKTEGFLPL
jgi:acetyl esterase/lipase